MSRYRNDSDDSFDDFEDIGISVMEELDPEPQPKSGSFYAREFVLGVLLVLAVLGFAGWQWWQTEYRQGNYALGEQAARRFDWDEASARFSAADGYRDAGTRAQAASERVRERDEHYSHGMDHFNGGRWAAALVELRAVAEVQPDYRDVTSMQAAAEKQVYRDALLGSVAMRPDADPPGLYYRAGWDWIWLEGSDEQSLPWGQGTTDHLLYDAPVEGWVPPTRANRRNLGQDGRELDGRRLMVASFGGGNAPGVDFRELPFKLSDFHFFEWHHEGVWGIRYADAVAPRVGEPGPVRDRINYIQQITYHAFGTKIMRSTNAAYYGMNVALMSYNRNGDGLLLANWTRHEDGTFTTDLYLNSLTNGESRLLYSHNGGFGSASFSDDGRYVFLTTYKSSDDALEDRLHLLIDTTEARPPRVLLQQIGLRTTNEYYMLNELVTDAQLLERSPASGKLFFTYWMSSTNYISMLDPDGPGLAQPLASVKGLGRIQWTAASTEGPDVVLWGVGTTGVRTAVTPGQQALVVVTIPPDGPPVVAQMDMGELSNITMIAQRGADLVYLLYGYTREGQLKQAELRSVPLLGAGQGRLESTLLSTYTYPSRGKGRFYFDEDFRFSFGPGMLAYLDGSTLRAVTYDGQTDLALEGDVAALFRVGVAEP
ncbi:MAG TPA: hypothetical protein VEY08_01750 [Chloroflexia bacterium]|nr:hypothetical protein [Chloroflexia bacterium]